VLDQAGRYLSRLGFRNTVVLLSARSRAAEGGRVLDAMAREDVAAQTLIFNGECSREEIGRHVLAVQALPEAIDGLVAVGGGKVVDAGRAIAHRLGIPVAVVPSLASNDAPCAGVSVIYTPGGVTEDAEVYDENPALVLVDSGVIAQADERYLVAGMGDAMATWYEARSCARTPGGFTVFGGRPTLAGTALAQLCADTIYEHGLAALKAVRRSEVSEALEHVVEANTLLSGLGYESGGLAIAHAVAQGYTVIDSVHRNYLHGEMVAMGVMAQLVLEDWTQEAERAARFFVSVGLPVHLEQLGLSPESHDDLDAIVEAALVFPFVVNMPFEVTAARLHEALLGADRLGRDVAT
jgi:glycerol dehydrogenase